MTQAIIFARVTSQHSHIDTKIDNLRNTLFVQSIKIPVTLKFYMKMLRLSQTNI